MKKALDLSRIKSFALAGAQSILPEINILGGVIAIALEHKEGK